MITNPILAAILAYALQNPSVRVWYRNGSALYQSLNHLDDYRELDDTLGTEAVYVSFDPHKRTTHAPAMPINESDLDDSSFSPTSWIMGTLGIKAVPTDSLSFNSCGFSTEDEAIQALLYLHGQSDCRSIQIGPGLNHMPDAVQQMHALIEEPESAGDPALRTYPKPRTTGWVAKTPNDLFSVLKQIALHAENSEDSVLAQLVARVWRLNSPLLEKIDTLK